MERRQPSILSRLSRPAYYSVSFQLVLVHRRVRAGALLRLHGLPGTPFVLERLARIVLFHAQPNLLELGVKLGGAEVAVLQRLLEIGDLRITKKAGRIMRVRQTEKG